MLHLPLRTVRFILAEFEKHLIGYNIIEYVINEFEKVILVEDSLPLYICIEESNMPVCLNANEVYSWTAENDFMDMPTTGETYYHLYIEELLYNDLGFKYNHTQFSKTMSLITGIQHLYIDITYTKFRGYTRPYWNQDTIMPLEYVGDALPTLNLRERYNEWEGCLYYLVIIEFDDVNAITHYAVAFTLRNPHSYISSMTRKWIKHGGFCEGDSIRAHYVEMKQAFESWGKTSRQQRIENNLRYSFFEKRFREKNDVWQYADQMLERAYANEFEHLDRNTCLMPSPKWVSEQLVLTLVKKIYPRLRVIPQHRPFFLKTKIGGQMSYDIYIPHLHLAIEYQGKQHFEPVDFFGGLPSYLKTVERDALKLRLSIANGVRIVYINYTEAISRELISTKIKLAIES